MAEHLTSDSGTSATRDNNGSSQQRQYAPPERMSWLTDRISNSNRASTTSSQTSSRQPSPPRGRTSGASEGTPMVNSLANRRNYQSTDNVHDSPDFDEGTQQENRTERQQQQQQQEQAQRNVQQRNNASQHGKHEKVTPWYKTVADQLGSLELENKGSVARDHLALERTFLAWLRTSLTFASIGIAITQLFRLNTNINSQANFSNTSSSYPPPILPPGGGAYRATGGIDAYADSANRLRRLGKPLGATFIGIAIVVLLIGFRRYFEGQHWVVKGKFPASRGSVALIALVSGALMVSSLVVILAIAPGALET